MQKSRLFRILHLLISGGPCTAGRLAEETGVSVRTVLRDIDVLSLAGVPVYSKKGKNGGIFISENYVLSRSMFSEDEQDSILTALSALKLLGGDGADEALLKLGAMFSRNAGSWLSIDISDWDDDGKTLSVIRECILSKKILTFKYFSGNGEASLRQTEPYKLIFKQRAWYLSAYCLKKQQQRFFKLSRIRDAVSGGSFEGRDLKSASDKVCDFVIPEISIEMKLDEKCAYRAYDEFGGDNVTKIDGGYLVKAKFPHNEWVYGYVMSFMPYAEVISPAHLRNEIKKRMEQGLKKFL